MEKACRRRALARADVARASSAGSMSAAARGMPLTLTSLAHFPCAGAGASDYDLVFVAANAADKRGSVIGGASLGSKGHMVGDGASRLIADVNNDERALSRTEWLIALVRVALNRCSPHVESHART